MNSKHRFTGDIRPAVCWNARLEEKEEEEEEGGGGGGGGGEGEGEEEVAGS